MDNEDTDRQRHGGQIAGGLIIIVVGLALLADRVGFSDLHLSAHFWPLILIVLGVMKLADSAPGRGGRRRSLRSGAWLVYVGCWGLVTELHLFGLGYHNSWPLLIIGFGLVTVWRAIEGPSGACGRIRES